MNDTVMDFIKDHAEEDLCVYYEPRPELGGVRVIMRRNTALVKRIISYLDIDTFNDITCRELLDSMYNEFDFKED